MEDECRLLVLLSCGQTELLRFEAASQDSKHAVQGLLEALTLEGPRQAAGLPKDGRAWHWQAVCGFLRRHPRLRRLSLQGATLTATGLAALLEAAPSVVECDVTFALPLLWPSYSALQQRPEFSGVDFRDTLCVEPSVALSPLQVVTAQAYGLHCGRVDVCFRFASPANKAMTGPLERFERFFEGHTRFSAMFRCLAFEATAPPLTDRAHVEVQVVFCARGSGREHLYVFNVAKQKDTEFRGCWMTEGVLPIDSMSMWDGSMAEE